MRSAPDSSRTGASGASPRAPPAQEPPHQRHSALGARDVHVGRAGLLERKADELAPTLNARPVVQLVRPRRAPSPAIARSIPRPLDCGLHLLASCPHAPSSPELRPSVARACESRSVPPPRSDAPTPSPARRDRAWRKRPQRGRAGARPADARPSATCRKTPGEKKTFKLEDSGTGRPSRKSTRKGAHRAKPDSNLRRRETRRTRSPEERAARRRPHRVSR